MILAKHPLVVTILFLLCLYYLFMVFFYKKSSKEEIQEVINEEKRKEKKVSLLTSHNSKQKIKNVIYKYLIVLVVNLLIAFFYFSVLFISSLFYDGSDATKEYNLNLSVLVALSVYVTFLEFKLIAKKSENFLYPTIALVLFPLFSAIARMLFL